MHDVLLVHEVFGHVFEQLVALEHLQRLHEKALPLPQIDFGNIAVGPWPGEAVLAQLFFYFRALKQLLVALVLRRLVLRWPIIGVL